MKYDIQWRAHARCRRAIWRPARAMITERGSMVWMSANMQHGNRKPAVSARRFGRMFGGESAVSRTPIPPRAAPE